jgi:hypothetical protein
LTRSPPRRVQEHAGKLWRLFELAASSHSLPERAVGEELGAEADARDLGVKPPVVERDDVLVLERLEHLDFPENAVALLLAGPGQLCHNHLVPRNLCACMRGIRRRRLASPSPGSPRGGCMHTRRPCMRASTAGPFCLSRLLHERPCSAPPRCRFLRRMLCKLRGVGKGRRSSGLRREFGRRAGFGPPCFHSPFFCAPCPISSPCGRGQTTSGRRYRDLARSMQRRERAPPCASRRRRREPSANRAQPGPLTLV